MTQGLTNHFDRDFDLPESDDLGREPGGGDLGGGDLGDLLDQVRDNTVRLVSELPGTPRVLRVRAGEVSVEVEWPPDRDVAASPPGQPEPAATPTAPTPGHFLTAPTVGVFYHAPDPGSPPFVREGDTVVLGQQIGIVEAMKLMIPVQADAEGRVVEVLKGNGEPVEYGERLFALAPDPS